MNNKKSEMTFPILAAAIIVLIVLVIVIGIFISKANFFQQGTSNCASSGGKCIKKDADCEGAISPFECKDEEKCCFLG